MEKYARFAGYSVALALLAGLLFIVSMLREGVLFPHNRVKVSFPAIGTLMEDDPVKMQGVQVGRIASIDAVDGVSIATLEFFHRTPVTKGSRFINFNYSLFGARMVILVPGESKERIDPDQVQAGDFSTGVAETIHRVEDLLVTVMEYKKLSSRLERGSDTSLSLQMFLTTKVYPVLEEFGAMTHDMETLQNEAGRQLDQLTAASLNVDRFGRDMAANSDTLILRANRTLAQLASLTVQSTAVLKGLEEIVVACQDTSKGASRFLVQREIYDHALSMTHALQDLLKVAKKDGLTDAIHFWRNVHINWGRPR
ncbi:MAG: Mammalian cell entry related domain protein [Fibrobacteres bacterium]|nr:Mammalian cell entry related domain protein [Fibrobacterota bacterium]